MDEPKVGEWWIVIIDLGDRQGVEVARRGVYGWQIVDMDGYLPFPMCEPVRRLDLEKLATQNETGT